MLNIRKNVCTVRDCSEFTASKVLKKLSLGNITVNEYFKSSKSELKRKKISEKILKKTTPEKKSYFEAWEITESLNKRIYFRMRKRKLIEKLKLAPYAYITPGDEFLQQKMDKKF